MFRELFLREEWRALVLAIPPWRTMLQQSIVLIDLQIVNNDGSIRGVGGDVEGKLPSPEIDFGKGTALRSLNWREVPTID